jgi:hypothetical protein
VIFVGYISQSLLLTRPYSLLKMYNVQFTVPKVKNNTWLWVSFCESLTSVICSTYEINIQGESKA